MSSVTARRFSHMRLDLDSYSLVERYGDRISRTALYGSLAVIYVWFGGMKFTSYEANGIEAFVKHSPFLSWFYAFLSVQVFSNFLGVLEITVGALIAARLLHPVLSLVGGTLSCGLFLTTLSFLASTPGVSVVELGLPAISVVPGQFLLKDLGLLAISLWIAVDSLKAIKLR